MKQFIKLKSTKYEFVEQIAPESTTLNTNTYEEALYIKPCDIKIIKRFKGITLVCFYGDEETITVDETPEEIFKLIEECGK